MNYDGFWYPFTVGAIVGAMLSVVVSMMFLEYVVPYKQGQIDALSGKVLFELKKQEDGSIVWVRK